MRIMIDSMIGLMLLGIVGAVVFYHRQASSQIEDQRFVCESLARLQEQAVYRGAIESEIHEDSRQRYARIVRPEWFGSTLPVNVIVGGNHPWIDIAPPGDLSEHPPDPVCEDSSQAGFWYNPSLGVFRARVPRQVSDRQTLDLYNALNSSALARLVHDSDPARAPIALAPSDLVVTNASPKPPTVERLYTNPPTGQDAAVNRGWSPGDPRPAQAVAEAADVDAGTQDPRGRPTLRTP